MNERSRSVAVGAVVGLLVGVVAGGTVVVLGARPRSHVDGRAGPDEVAVSAPVVVANTNVAGLDTLARAAIAAPESAAADESATLDTSATPATTSSFDPAVASVRHMLAGTSFVSRVPVLRQFEPEGRDGFAAELRYEAQVAGVDGSAFDRALERRSSERAELRAAIDAYQSAAEAAVENALIGGLLERRSDIDEHHAVMRARDERGDDTVVDFQSVLTYGNTIEYLALSVPLSGSAADARNLAVATAERYEQVLRGDLGLQ